MEKLKMLNYEMDCLSIKEKELVLKYRTSVNRKGINVIEPDLNYKKISFYMFIAASIFGLIYESSGIIDRLIYYNLTPNGMHGFEIYYIFGVAQIICTCGLGFLFYILIYKEHLTTYKYFFTLPIVSILIHLAGSFYAAANVELGSMSFWVFAGGAIIEHTVVYTILCILLIVFSFKILKKAELKIY